MSTPLSNDVALSYRRARANKAEMVEMSYRTQGNDDSNRGKIHIRSFVPLFLLLVYR